MPPSPLPPPAPNTLVRRPASWIHVKGLPAVELVPSMSTAHQLQLAVPAAAWEGGARSFTSSVSSPSSRDSGRARKTTIYPAPTSSLPDLRHLNVGRCQGMTDLALARVAGAFPGLEGVHLEHCLGVTDAGVRALAVGCRGLRALGLRNCGQVHTIWKYFEHMGPTLFIRQPVCFFLIA